MTTVGPETTENIDALLEARRSLDEREFEGLYRRYHPMLVRYARRQGATDPEGVADLKCLASVGGAAQEWVVPQGSV